MSRIIVGAGPAAAAVAETFENAENPSIWAGAERRAGDAPGSSAPLARALVAFEAEAIGHQPDEIVLADDSDAALAAALVATKLLIPLVAVDDARHPSSANGRLIAQLAPT